MPGRSRAGRSHGGLAEGAGDAERVRGPQGVRGEGVVEAEALPPGQPEATISPFAYLFSSLDRTRLAILEAPNLRVCQSWEGERIPRMTVFRMRRIEAG